MRITNRWVAGPMIALGVLVLALTAACGGDDEDPTAAPTDAPGGATTEAAATLAPDDSDDSDDGDSGAASAGQITIGDDTWELDPRQCSMFPGGVVSVWGFAVGDPDVEIVFDVFENESTNLSVSSSAANWSALSDNIEATVDGETVTGTATVVTANGDSAAATFEFNCG